MSAPVKDTRLVPRAQLYERPDEELHGELTSRMIRRGAFDELRRLVRAAARDLDGGRLFIATR